MEKTISIKSHSVEGLGGFLQKTNINFSSKGPSVLLGINGSGKTSILDSIYSSISIVLSPFLDTTKKNFRLTDSNISINAIKSTISTTLDLKFQNDQLHSGETKVHYDVLMHKGVKPNIQNDNLDFLKNYMRKNILNGELPVFRYFQALKIFDNSEKKLKLNSIERRTMGYQSNSDTSIQIQTITNFILNQINIENSERIEKKNFQHETTNGKYIRRTLNLFTSILYREEVTVSAKASKYSTNQSLTFSKKDNEVEFIQLSSGEKYVFSIVLELIYRIVTLNGVQNELRNTPGIVLIDEIESHLHPKWQISILEALQQCFPNVQFIVSTHSPLIASSIHKEQIIALNDFEVIPNDLLPNIYAGSSDEILEKILFTDSKLSKYEKFEEHIDKLIKKREFDEAEKEFLKLKEKLDNSNPQWLKDLDNKISFSKL